MVYFGYLPIYIHNNIILSRHNQCEHYCWYINIVIYNKLNFSLIIQSEAPIIIKPYLPDLTESEVHAVMMGGFSTVAGMINLNIIINIGVIHIIVFTYKKKVEIITL